MQNDPEKKDYYQVNELMELFFKQKQLRQSYLRVRIKEAWTKAVGAFIADRVQEVNLKDGKLFISTSSPSVRQEILHARTRIITRLNEILGGQYINEIILH